MKYFDEAEYYKEKRRAKRDFWSMIALFTIGSMIALTTVGYLTNQRKKHQMEAHKES